MKRSSPRRPVCLTRVYRFNAGHRLYHPRRGAAWNLSTFGKCSYPGGHGHNYVLEVTLKGCAEAGSGLLFDRRRLDRLVERWVLEPLDHRNLNQTLRLDAGPAPTTEVLIVEIWQRLEGRVAASQRRRGGRAQLFRLRISETAKNSFEYHGPGRRASAQPSSPGSTARI
jgi:6-pyruvoyltetrahydropterin/6-carboxytetrahydropterin synthase